jgi:hypothetical protein
MHHRICATAPTRERLATREITFDERRQWLGKYRSSLPRIPNQTNRLVPTSPQRRNGMRTNEPGRPRDENPHASGLH